MSKTVALIGYPVGHSVSPAMQQAAFDHCGLDVRYERWETPLDRLAVAFADLRRPEVLGANVTIPLKEYAVPFLDRVDAAAKRIGAVNTIVNDYGSLTGYNTDASGFMRALKEEGMFDTEGRCGVVLGAGGVARAVAFALADSGIESLLIVNRSMDRAVELASALGQAVPKGPAVTAMPLEKARVENAFRACHLIVNCTSLGMKGSPTEGRSPLSAEHIPRDALVFDLVYNPIETPLLVEARKAGAGVVGGLAMLVYQGAESFRLWVDRDPPVDVMLQHARLALQ